MKKIFVILFSFVMIFTFTACKKKTDLNKISETLTNYNISLNLDVETKMVEATQTIEYVNNTESILKNIKFHLYPQFFEEGATEYIVPSTKMNNAYPNGISYCEFNIDRVKVDNQEKTVVYEQEFDSILNVELNSSLMPGEKTCIYMEYSFTLPNCEHRFGYGDNTINLGNFYPILAVRENGEYDITPYYANGDPFYSECANYNVNVVVDKNFSVYTSGDQIKKMENQDTIRLLKECDAGSKMAVTSIDDILDKVQDSDLIKLFLESKEHHEALGNEIHSLLIEYDSEEKEPNVMAKSMSWIKTNFKMGMYDPVKTAAELITDGCDMGIKSLNQYLNQYPAANDKTKELCRKLIKIEEDLREAVKRYL